MDGSDGGGRGPLGRLAGCGSGLLAAAATLRVLLLGPGPSDTAAAGAGFAPMRVEDVLLIALEWLGAGLALWLAVGSTLGLLSLLPGTAGRLAAEAARRVTPVVVSRTLALMLGASVGSGVLTAPAFAGGAQTVRSQLGLATASSKTIPDASAALVGSHTTLATTAARLGSPTLVATPVALSRAVPLGAGDGAVDGVGPAFRPTAPPPTADATRAGLLAPTPRPRASTHDLVTVRRGDSLWTVARRHLGPRATDAQVAYEWPRWYAANRALIGPDPNSLQPGQQLRPPGPAGASGQPSSGALTPAFGPTGPSGGAQR